MITSYRKTLRNAMHRLNPRILSLAGCRLANVDEIKNLSALTTFNLSGCFDLTNVDALKHLAGLQSLDLSQCITLTNMHGITKLPALQTLNLTGCRLSSVD